MTRDKCEEEIYHKMVEISKIYKQYNPKVNYLSIGMSGDRWSVSNSYHDKDIDKPIIEVKRMAKEMFKELGYNFLDYGSVIEYCHDSNSTKSFYFYKKTKNIKVRNYYFSPEELRAISKQVEELGWLDD